MNLETEVRKLIEAKEKIEAEIKEIDAKLEHLKFRLDEERRCMARKCPMENE